MVCWLFGLCVTRSAADRAQEPVEAKRTITQQPTATKSMTTKGAGTLFKADDVPKVNTKQDCLKPQDDDNVTAITCPSRGSDSVDVEEDATSDPAEVPIEDPKTDDSIVNNDHRLSHVTNDIQLDWERSHEEESDLKSDHKAPHKYDDLLQEIEEFLATQGTDYALATPDEEILSWNDAKVDRAILIHRVDRLCHLDVGTSALKGTRKFIMRCRVVFNEEVHFQVIPRLMEFTPPDFTEMSGDLGVMRLAERDGEMLDPPSIFDTTVPVPLWKNQEEARERIALCERNREESEDELEWQSDEVKKNTAVNEAAACQEGDAIREEWDTATETNPLRLLFADRDADSASEWSWDPQELETVQEEDSIEARDNSMAEADGDEMTRGDANIDVSQDVQDLHVEDLNQVSAPSESTREEETHGSEELDILSCYHTNDIDVVKTDDHGRTPDQGHNSTAVAVDQPASASDCSSTRTTHADAECLQVFKELPYSQHVEEVVSATTYDPGPPSVVNECPPPAFTHSGPEQKEAQQNQTSNEDTASESTGSAKKTNRQRTVLGVVDVNVDSSCQTLLDQLSDRKLYNRRSPLADMKSLLQKQTSHAKQHLPNAHIGGCARHRLSKTVMRPLHQEVWHQEMEQSFIATPIRPML